MMTGACRRGEIPRRRQRARQDLADDPQLLLLQALSLMACLSQCHSDFEARHVPRKAVPVGRLLPTQLDDIVA